MSTLKDRGIKISFSHPLLVLFSAMFLILTSITVNAADKIVTQETLLDRIQIEDMIVRYYVDMSAGKSHDLAQYYTEDAVLDVNGVISKGRKEIEKLYSSVGDSEGNEGPKNMHMLLNNPVINIDGNTATAWVIWTGVENYDIKKPPRLYEQGREYDDHQR